jgi:hypothetical protein
MLARGLDKPHTSFFGGFICLVGLDVDQSGLHVYQQHDATFFRAHRALHDYFFRFAAPPWLSKSFSASRIEQMSRRPALTKAKVKRVVKGVVDAGIKVARIEADIEAGRIIVIAGRPGDDSDIATADDELERWRRKRDAGQA